VISPCRFTLGEKSPGIHCIGVWVGPRVCLGVIEKKPLPGNEPQLLCRPARILVHLYIFVLFILLLVKYTFEILKKDFYSCVICELLEPNKVIIETNF
jgi:cytochrome b561